MRIRNYLFLFFIQVYLFVSGKFTYLAEVSSLPYIYEMKYLIIWKGFQVLLPMLFFWSEQIKKVSYWENSQLICAVLWVVAAYKLPRALKYQITSLCKEPPL